MARLSLVCASLLLALGLAQPASGQHIDPAAINPTRIRFAPKTTTVGPGWVDWTAGLILASSRAEPEAGAYGERTIVEQQARTDLIPLMMETARKVRFSATMTTRQILDQESPAARLMERNLSSAWHVVETRYYTSGSIEVQGELPILRWFKPALLLEANGTIPKDMNHSRTTGFVFDARGVHLEPTVAARILGPSGAVLYSIASVTTAFAQKRLPILYVTDPADPLACRRAGDNPLFVSISDVSDAVDMVVDRQDAIRVRTVSQDPHLFAQARVVVVTDP